MENKTQKRAQIIMRVMILFALVGLFWGGYFGVSKAYASQFINGGVNKDPTATLLTEQITNIYTYDGTVGTPMYFQFIPDSSETYTIKSIGAIDTEGELYDSSGVPIVMNDNASDTDVNFCINRYLTAGITYYLRVINYTMISEDPTMLSITGDFVGTIQPPLPDTTQPIVSSVGVPNNGTYMAGNNLDLTVDFSEAVTVDTTNGTPSIAINIGGATVNANYIGGSGSTALGFRYTVATGDQDSDGITIAAMSLNGGTMRDAAGNDAVLTLNSVASTAGVKVDTTAPTVSSVSVPSNGTYKIGDNLDFTVNLSETVMVNTGGGTPYIEVIIGNSTVHAAYYSGSGGNSLVFRYTVAEGDQDSDGIVVGTMTLNSGTMKDAAGNNTNLTLNSVASTSSVLVNGVVPTVNSVSVPSNGIYKAGDNLDFTVRFSEAVTVTGTPRIVLTIGSNTAYADCVSGSGTSDLIFRYSVTTGAQDSNGITVGAMSLNGGTINNSAGNNASLTLNGVASTANVLVDTTAPMVASVSVPANGTYQAGSNLDLTVNFSEAVAVTGTPKLAITVGSTVINADYISGSGTSALVFRYTVVIGDQDNDGIAVGTISLNGGTMRDVAGNVAVLTLNSVASTTGVLVDGVAPTVSSVSVPSNGTYKIGDNLDFTVNFSEVVTVNAGGGTPRIAITFGSTTVYANYVSGSESTALVFRYTVAAGEQDSDGIAVGTMTLNGGTMKDMAGNNTDLTLKSVASTSSVLVNGVVPTVNSVSAPSNGIYKAGDDLDFTVRFSEAVTVTGTPRIALTVGSNTVNADYVSGSGSLDLVFRYSVTTGAQDSNGITVGAMSLNGGTIKNSAGNNASLTMNGVASTANVLVDAAAPVVASVSVPANGTYQAGSNLDLTVNFLEVVTVDSTNGTPSIAITIGGATVYANYIGGSGSTALGFRYTVATGDQDSDGITIAAMSLNGGTMKDAAGNNAVLTLNGIASTTGVLVDGVSPTVSSVTVPSNGTYKIGDNLDFTVYFSEAVTVNTGGGTPRIAITVGSTTAYASYVSGSGSTALVFRYTVAAGAQDSDGIAVGAMSPNGGMMMDAVGNDTNVTLNSIASTAGVLVDGVAPTVSSVSVPSNGNFKIGDNLDFTVNFTKAVTVNIGGGTPRLTITVGSTTIYADYVSGSGSSALVFRYTVTSGAQDSDGITVGTMSLNGGMMKDTAGNNAILTLNSVDPTSGIMVDGVVPVITSVQVPASGLYKEGDTLEFAVIYSEDVVVTGTDSVLKINVGGITRDASYTSKSGSRITYRYIVQAGDNGGYTIGTDLEIGTTTIYDNAGNNALISLHGVESTAGITFDTTAPGMVADIHLSDNDTITGIDGRDFTVSFTELADESDVAAYQIYLYKDSEAPVNAAAMDLLAAGSRVAVKTITKTANNDGTAASLGSSVTTDSKGQILNGGDYRIIIRAVDSVGNDSFAIAGTSALIVKDVDNTPTGGNNPPSSDSTPLTEGKIEKDQKRNENAPAASLNDNSEDLKSKILSAAEQEQVAKGKDAKVILKIEDISSSVSEEDKKQIEEKLAVEQQTKADTALLYIDISLFKQVGDGEETKITETSGKISISIEVPESMWNTKDGIDRSYHVIRVHDGVAELLTGTYDPTSHLFTFETDRFSTYALTYKDVNVSSDQSEGSITDKITAFNDFYHLRLTAKATKTTQKLSYVKVSGADGYLIYGAQCGKKMRKLADVAGTVITYTVNNLKQATYYKYQVKAYKIINGKKVVLASSKIIHTITTGKIYANPTKITSDVAVLDLAKDETKSVIYQVVLPQGMKIKEHTTMLRYETTNSKVATINKGIIKAEATGVCYIYAYAQNGEYAIIKVTVK